VTSTRQNLIGWKPVAYNLNAASARLRCYEPLAFLQRRGVVVELFQPAHLENYKTLVIQKSCELEDIELARKAQARGTHVIYDGCDNLFYFEEGDDVHAARAARLRRLLAHCNSITVSTPALQKVIREETGREAVVIPDPVVTPRRLSRWRLAAMAGVLRRQWRARRKGAPLELVWFGNHAIAGAEGGLRDLLHIAPLLEKLHREYPLRLTVISNGHELFDATIKPLPFPTRYCGWRHYAHFCGTLPAYDVCVIPFSRNPVTECKSNNRLALSLYLGVPVVADGIASYREFAPFCRLDDWEKGLREYAAAPMLRRDDVRRGRRYVEENYTLSQIAQQWKKLFDIVT
jgi:glycosyltransferase involved in cell wall biosynthesis